MSKDKQVALMYSGGLDTTYTAIQLGQRFNKVHLLTFCNGFCIRPQASRRHVGLLQKKFGPDKFEHTIIPLAHIFSMFKQRILAEMKKYKSPLVFDLCCRLSMEVATILYCLDKKINYASDGSNPRTQGQMFIQQEEYLNVVNSFFAGYQITIERQHQQLDSREQISRYLAECGIKTSVKWLRYLGITTQLFTQPFCLWAPVAFLFTSDLRKIPLIRYFGLSLEEAISFRLTKEKLARQFIEYLRYNYSLSYKQQCAKKIANLFTCREQRK